MMLKMAFSCVSGQTRKMIKVSQNYSPMFVRNFSANIKPNKSLSTESHGSLEIDDEYLAREETEKLKYSEYVTSLNKIVQSSLSAEEKEVAMTDLKEKRLEEMKPNLLTTRRKEKIVAADPMTLTTSNEVRIHFKEKFKAQMNVIYTSPLSQQAKNDAMEELKMMRKVAIRAISQSKYDGKKLAEDLNPPPKAILPPGTNEMARASYIIPQEPAGKKVKPVKVVKPDDEMPVEIDSNLSNEEKMNLLQSDRVRFFGKHLIQTLNEIIAWSPQDTTFETLNPEIQEKILHMFRSEESTGNSFIMKSDNFYRVLVLFNQLQLPLSALKVNRFQEIFQKNAEFLTLIQIEDFVSLLKNTGIQEEEIEIETLDVIERIKNGPLVAPPKAAPVMKVVMHTNKPSSSAASDDNQQLQGQGEQKVFKKKYAKKDSKVNKDVKSKRSDVEV